MVYKKYMVTSTPFKGALDVYEWLSSFFNSEQGFSKREFTLENMKLLVKKAGYPEKCAPSIHMAGSKGKGSVTGMISSILNSAGLSTACYTSPHIMDFRERLTLGGQFFSEEIYAAAGNELRTHAESLISEDRIEPSFFELLTLWFFLCARLAPCDAMAVETGLGGRLDATNVLLPLVSVITLIELEHTEYLGNTIAAIASEKAGIIKPERPLILAEQSDEALGVFKKRAAECDSPLFYFPECTEIQNIRIDKKGTSFDLKIKTGAPEKKALFEIFPDLFLPLPGVVQAKNAGLAALAVKTAFPDIENESIRKGLAAFTLPGRFERISDKPPVVIDGAHTKRSLELCLDTFTSLYGSEGILLFGCAADKDALSMAELSIPCFSKIIITTPGSFKKSNPEEIYSTFLAESKKAPNATEIFFIPDTIEAINRAIEIALKLEIPILGAGSFYLIAEIRKGINRN